MKICIICGEYPPGPHGGIGTIVQLAARKFVEYGHQVKVIGIYNMEYGGEDFFIDKGVEVYRIRQKVNRKLSFIVPWYKQYRQIKKWAGDGQIDMVEAPESRGWFAFWPALNVPCIIRAHGSETDEKITRGLKPNRLTRLLESLSYRRAQAASAISNFSKRSAEKLFKPRKPLTTIHYGIPFVPPVVKPRSKSSIVFAGTLGEKKGVIQLTKAAIDLYNRGLYFTVIMYGKDTFYQGMSMIEYLKSLMPAELQDRFSFPGHATIETLYNTYYECTLAVFPSHWESFGLTPIEAMMCGCAVIHSRIPTGFELIDNNINGILVDPYDHKELAEKIALLLKDEVLRKQLGDNGVIKVKSTFNLDVMCSKLLRFYEEEILEFRASVK